jgi:TRAP-type C4-dicarboxylate transport system substrate-binding protein
MKELSRRGLLSHGSAVAVGLLAAPAILSRRSEAAEFAFKCGTALPDGYPMCIRGREAMQEIKDESGGRLDITLYTNSVLGQDTAMISQGITGALEMYFLPIDLLASKNPTLPPDLPELSVKHFTAAALAEREDWQKMGREETQILTGKGIIFNSPDTKPFQEVLRKSGYYTDMRQKSGEKTWALLEKHVGALV